MEDKKIFEELKDKTIDKLMSNPKKLVNGSLTIGYDISKKGDHCCLVVTQYRGKNEIMVINEFYDEEADRILKLLLGGKN